MKAASKSAGIVIGGEPRIDFLPPEVKARNGARRTRRSLIAVVLVVVVGCAAGYGFATTLAIQSEVKLAEEQAETQRLLAEQAKYSAVGTVSSATAAVENARIVGSATEIVWADYLAELKAALPSGATIESFVVDSQAAVEAAPEVAVPLQSSRVATVTFAVRVPTLPVVDSLLVNLRELSGFAGAVVTSITLEDDSYLASGVLHVNADAFEKRFFDRNEAGEPPADEPDSSSAEAPADDEEE
ncbi:MAG: hypothetical protein WED09_11550 [Homoserinimonas sp.]